MRKLLPLVFILPGAVAGAPTMEWHAMKTGLPPNSISRNAVEINLENRAVLMRRLQDEGVIKKKRR